MAHRSVHPAVLTSMPTLPPRTQHSSSTTRSTPAGASEKPISLSISAYGLLTGALTETRVSRTRVTSSGEMSTQPLICTGGRRSR